MKTKICNYCSGDGWAYYINYRKFWWKRIVALTCHVCLGEGEIDISYDDPEKGIKRDSYKY